jgi:O-antigen/teichoic acid export membrane protein
MSTLVLVPEALGAVLTPAVATLLGAGQMDRIRSGYARALRLVLLGSLPAVAVGLALGPELVTLLFGRGFRDSRIPLLILLAPFPLIPLMSTSFALIEGLGKVKFPLVAGVASAVLNVALDFALIPSYSTNGAAAANSIAQGISAVAILVYGVRLVGGVRWEVNPLARMAITSAVVGVRVISHDDAAWLRQAFGSKFGGAIGTAIRRVEVR